MDNEFSQFFDNDTQGDNEFSQFFPSNRTIAKPKQSLATPQKGIVNDTLVGLGKGTMQLPGAVTGLADIPLGLAGLNRPVSRAADYFGEKTGFQPSKWAEQANADYSPAMREAQANINQVWDDPNTNGLDVAKAYLDNPRSIYGTVVESLPSMVAGNTFGRAATGLSALSKNVPVNELAKRATLAE